MNRPIKFRAWDLINKMMWPYAVPRFNGIIEVYSQSKGPGNYFLTARSVELLQFTGLHDKDGKEIWEGDVFLVDPESKTAKAQIVFKDGAFIKYYPHKYFTCPIDKIDLGIGKVIGNIFENPELLEVKNETE